MKIVVAGLGYVGTVSAACLAYYGHRVTGVDVSGEKIEALNRGVAPVREPRLNDLLDAGLKTGLLSVTTNLLDAIGEAEVVLICVGTPSASDGSLSLRSVIDVVTEIGGILASYSHQRLAVIVRSTMVPGSSQDVVVPALLKAMGQRELPPSVGYGVQPEFLREGSAVGDFFEPAKTVIGTEASWVAELLLRVNAPLPGPKFLLRVAEAEMTKYLDNAFHALKVAFANEMGRIAVAAGVDTHQVFQPFWADHKLNISERYLRPGAPFGGSCLPKDIRALRSRAKGAGVSSPLLDGILESNDSHLAALLRDIEARNGRRVVVLGLAFKSNTDDLRESPFVRMVQELARGPRPVICHDATIASSQLFGVNAQIFSSLFALAEGAPKWVKEQPALHVGDVVVLCTEHPSHVAAIRHRTPQEVEVVDLTGQWNRGWRREPSEQPGFAGDRA